MNTNTIAPATPPVANLLPYTPSPFASLQAIRDHNAKMHDRAYQARLTAEHTRADRIIAHYYLGNLTREQAIALLAMYCKRSRATAMLNITQSQYTNYTQAQLLAITAPHHKELPL